MNNLRIETKKSDVEEALIFSFACLRMIQTFPNTPLACVLQISRVKGFIFLPMALWREFVGCAS